MSPDRATLPMSERLAIQAAMKELHAKHGSGSEVASLLGISQQAVNKATKYASAGLGVERALLGHLKLTLEAFVAKYAPPEERAPLPDFVVEKDERYPNRARAIAAARLLRRDERAIARVASERLDADEDPPESWWFEQIDRAIADLKDPFRRKLGQRDAGPSDF